MSRPSFADRAVRRTILVDVEPSGAYARGVIAGVGRLCRERRNVRLNHNSAEWELSNDRRKIDGVIAVVQANDIHDPSTRYGCPVVNVSSITSPVPFPTVTVNNIAVGRVAADHLLSQGYMHFACHFESRRYFSKLRADGFRQRLAESDRQCAMYDTAPGHPAEQTPETIRRETAKWLVDLPKPLGLFTHSDNRAATLMEICQDADITIPEQVGLIGVDDDQLLYMTLNPTLSSIDPAADVIGFRAAELLLDLIDGNPPPAAPIFVAPRGVVQRLSTEPAFLDDELLAMAVNFIREHATQPITVLDVLEGVPLSRRTLERKFQERLGRSPADEIRRVQMDRAKWLLLDTDQKPAAIAKAVGFTAYSNFSVAFRRQQGMTPLEYVRKFRKH